MKTTCSGATSSSVTRDRRSALTSQDSPAIQAYRSSMSDPTPRRGRGDETSSPEEENRGVSHTSTKAKRPAPES